MKELTVVLGNQLFDFKHYKNDDYFFMCEDYELCTHYKYHKHKIIHFLASMRDFRDYLVKDKNKKVHYQELDKRFHYISHLESYIKDNKISKVNIYEIEDKFFEKKLKSLFESLQVEIEIRKTPMFLTSREDFNKWLDPDVTPLMNNFYKVQRKKFEVLIEDKKPKGGKWNYDGENRKKIPKKFDVDEFVPKTLSSKNIDDVKELVERYFGGHPGKVDKYWIPTKRKDAINWFKKYLDERFKYFGRFQDAIDDRAPFLYHSLISPFINMGLITPKEVINEVEQRLNDNNLNDVEGFIRQVLGWREFVRGIYQNYSEKEENDNFFNHKKKLNKHWYEATTGIPPLDDAIEKANEWGYCHHIERLMVIGNLMLMLKIDPKEVHRWFMEMFVDSSDWVMGPNVYGMSQFSDGGIFATKPYFSGSNYLLKMSNYPKGDWCDGVDGLYWRFIEDNKGFFKNNYRMSMMVSSLEKMDKDKKKRIFEAASLLEDKLTLN